MEKCNPRCVQRTCMCPKQNHVWPLVSNQAKNSDFHQKNCEEKSDWIMGMLHKWLISHSRTRDWKVRISKKKRKLSIVTEGWKKTTIVEVKHNCAQYTNEWRRKEERRSVRYEFSDPNCWASHESGSLAVQRSMKNHREEKMLPRLSFVKNLLPRFFSRQVHY